MDFAQTIKIQVSNMLRYSGSMNCFVVILALVFALPGNVLADDHLLLLRKLQKKINNAEQRDAAVATGQERALICGYCHGDDGNSLKPEVPNLAGQNPDYLLEQIGRFARGERKDFVMNSLAAKFSDDEQINLAIFYAEQQVKPQAVDPARAKRGRQIYSRHCLACHGSSGRGNTGYARLAGQKQAYLAKTLNRFRDATNQSANRKRRSTVMEPIAAKLTEQDIQNLAAYLASM